MVQERLNTINNSDIYDTYKELYLSKKEREERLIQGIEPANGLKERVGAKRNRWHGTDIDNPRKCNLKDT